MPGLYTGAKGLWGGEAGLKFGQSLSTPPGLLADVTGGGPPPVITNGILQEGSIIDFIMMEDNTSYILQEA